MPINNVTAHNSLQEEGKRRRRRGKNTVRAEAAAIRRGAADGSGDWN